MDLSRDPPISTIYGAGEGDYFNDLPALVTGDVNGDGIDDLLMGARFGDGPEDSREDSGEAYLIYGGSSLPSALDLAAGEADVTIFGAAGKSGSGQGDQLGFAGALADVNRDGLADIILGAPFALRADSGAAAGLVYVVLGRHDLPPVIDLAAQDADLVLTGTHTSSFFGDAVAGADVNGDGFEDIIVGAPFEARRAGLERSGQMAGAAFVFFGSENPRGARDTAADDYDVAVYGAEEFQGGDETGDNVAAGDLNGDGLADLIITAEAADGPNNERSVAAEVYVVYGSTDISGVLDMAAGDQDVTVFGANNNDTTGFNVGAADLTADGVDDLLVSLRGGDGEGERFPESGELHVFPGGNLPEVIDLASYEEDAYIYGADSADFLGNGIAAADFDGDGALELLVGLPGGDGAANDPSLGREAGEAHVLDVRSLSGAARIGVVRARTSAFGARAEDRLGTSVAAGDLDGNGRPEIIVLATYSDGPDGTRTDSGAVYIIAGS